MNTRSSLWPKYHQTFLVFMGMYGLVVLGLSTQGAERFVNLHLLLDTGNGILSLMLAVFLLAEQSAIKANVRKYLVVGFALAAFTEILHAVIGIEWVGSLQWISQSAGFLRPATWPPSTYVLPIALFWALYLKAGQSKFSPRLFALGMFFVTLGLLALSLYLPKYMDTGLLGIQRPTQAPLLLLWLVVIYMAWRERATHPLFEGLAWMGVLLFLSDLCMLYSTSPHEKYTMMAHVGKLFAYMLLHIVQMRVAAADSRARVVAEGELQQEKKRLQLALHELRYQKFALDQHAIVGTTDVAGNITYANRQFCEVSGYSLDELLGQNHRIINSGVHPTEYFTEMYRCIASGQVWSGEICNRAKDGHLYWVMSTIVPYLNEFGKPTQYISIRTDITGRKLNDEKIHQLAFYDVLTNLPNRRLLADRMHQTLLMCARNGEYGAVLFLDLDNFKALNDSKGHDIGDMLLIEVAQRLQASVRGEDTIARLGGDEFVVVLEGLGKDSAEAAIHAELVGEKIRATLDQPYVLKQYEHRTTSSIGVVLFDGHSESLDSLLMHADAAMYQAKSAGRNTIHFFDAQTQTAIEERLSMSNDLRDALALEQFQLYYQLQVDGTERHLGAEVLLRWIHPQRGMVGPLEFIPLAEQTGLIVPIGLWVLRTACLQLKRWQRDVHTRELTLAVNVSAKQFRHVEFLEQVGRILEETGAPARCLKLELTEGILLDDVEGTILKMLELQQLGVTFSIDDFGTGYSSLQYLKRLPLHQIKIDKSFVNDITTDSNDAAIVQTIIAMSQMLGLNVIAEGVETAAQKDFLGSRGCQAYQGYLFGKPMPIDKFESSIRELVI
ncbi:MAG: EAL domain-containing protein [Gallionella sp.]